MADDLYQSDFYLWTLAQADALRKRGAGGNALDYDLLAEEVGDLGSEQKNAVLSHLTRAIEHLYKLAWTQRDEPKGGWRREVRSHRQDAKRRLTPTIRNMVEVELEQLHLDAATLAGDSFDTYEPAAPRDASLRWSLSQILGETDDPLG